MTAAASIPCGFKAQLLLCFFRVLQTYWYGEPCQNSPEVSGIRPAITVSARNRTLQAALGQRPDARQAFLAQACSGDDHLLMEAVAPASIRSSAASASRWRHAVSMPSQDGK